MLRTRLVLGLLLVAGAIFLISARCVENDAVRRGPDGNWHLYGELFNETDIQGTGMVVRGEIFDQEGNVVSAGTAPTCPRELAPGKPVAYDVTFPNTEFQPKPATHKVTVVEGAALESPLPELTITPTITVEELAGNKLMIGARFTKLAGLPEYGFCIAFYDGSGDMIALPVNGLILDSFNLELGIRKEISRADIPGALDMRIWIFAVGESGSPFQPYVSFPIRLPFEKKIGATPQLPPIGS